ncbi:hypothetical protein E8E14_013821 [Neopestalotiopsis sp. 37M]|nr:hypothetical protein E8E14_013821 [Neopestalotiopsis sp. 37M]
MLTSRLSSLLNSKPFRFIVGPEKKEFMMHSTIVANMSKPFDALVNGSMKEAREGVAKRGALDNLGTDGPNVVKLWRTFLRDSGIPLSSFKTLGTDESLEGSWSDVLLAHARVYVLADYYHIDDLADLAERKLHQALVSFELKQSNTDAISDLVDYVCRNTVDGDESFDMLRVLLYRYCACNIQQLSQNERFKGLLQEMGDLSEAIIQRMLERLC